MCEKKRVLMVCLGNICRSPIAEAVFKDYIKKHGLSDKWEVDSAGLIDYHTGSNPDNRAMITLREKGITDYSHIARLIKNEDFHEFDWIFGMDRNNVRELNRMKTIQSGKAKVQLLGKYDPEGETIIRDPYYDNDKRGFEKAYEQCLRSVEAFFKENQ